MRRDISIGEILGAIGAGLGVIALVVAYQARAASPNIVSVSVKSLIEEERDWLLAQKASENSANIWIDTVASEIETSLQSLETDGYVVVVKEAVLAGDVPDLTQTVRASLGVRERNSGPVSRSADTLAVVSGAPRPETTAPTYGELLIEGDRDER